MADKGKITIRGRLSFPYFTAAEAFALIKKGQYPDSVKDEASAAPHFQVLVNQTQLDKVREWARDVYLPYCAEQFKTFGEKGKDALPPAEVDELLEEIAKPVDRIKLNTPFKAVNEATADMVPDAVAAIKVMGPRGGSFEKFAIVRGDDDITDPDVIFTKTAIIPIEQTKFDFYPGCEVRVTMSAYSYHNGKHPGFSARAGDLVFARDNSRLGGGTTFDENEILMDDDD